ncbi:ArsR/SmtB family transcription factor [Rhizomicrobium palustre]|nr:metalloregulator ArsR/SmtB family transcription factor [Rhizomicrobium palustre]
MGPGALISAAPSSWAMLFTLVSANIGVKDIALAASDSRNLKVMAKKADEAAALMRSLSHGARLKVLCELSAGEKSVGELVELSGLSQSALSQHLARLREENLVATRREAQTIYYSVADPKVLKLVRLLYELYCGK